MSYIPLHINPFHFLRAVQCAHKCLVPPVYLTKTFTHQTKCTTPYFHMDILTLPSSSRSRPLKEAGPVRMRPEMHLYITHATTSRSTPRSLMSIAGYGYEAYVCVCFFINKTLCAAFIWLPWDASSCWYVCLYCVKKLFIHKM